MNCRGCRFIGKKTRENTARKKRDCQGKEGSSRERSVARKKRNVKREERDEKMKEIAKQEIRKILSGFICMYVMYDSQGQTDRHRQAGGTKT